uniref:RNA polymerase beta'' subunit n=1 Tax=Sargassum polycystum TaxID=127578 RepID=UPI0020C8B809|nr:RNA polymerase beta'' subunit [Sargassum polycystum]YP_010418278.1 RNA polymerase beta'' subunit [Sargassum plagiophyllum]USF18262.1 RNA polymerase beta'' subunit [Sargassum polycystum]USF18496.1 RNA polymerase beta'' subunit [Sargassum plagiophyllum]
MLRKSKIFSNNIINKKELKKIIEWAFNNYGQRKAAYFVDQLKEMGFKYATKSGISISIEDLRIPASKITLMQVATKEVFFTESRANNGAITDVERFQKIISIWNRTSEELKERLIDFLKKNDPLNSVYVMAFSGARGNISQVRQLIGMRGLMSDPNGQIIDRAITANFREGLSITDYIISSYGARKGLVDTAIKTADSGYLTRRLVEVAQSIIISQLDCQTKRGIVLQQDSKEFLSTKELLYGRVLASSICKPKTKEIIGFRNQRVTCSLIEQIIKLNIPKVLIRSPLTCECRRSICQHCYGENLASGNLVELGETVGLIAAQSIGEPGTQLTMRTFHTGGVFTGQLTRQGRAECSGYVIFLPTLKVIPYRTSYGEDVVMSENQSSLKIINYANEGIKVKVESRTLILVNNHNYIKRNQVLFEAAPKIKDTNLAQKEIKYVYAKEGGEIILEKNGFPQNCESEDFTKRSKKNYIFWVLSGRVFSLPFNTNLRVRKLEKIYKNQALAQSKIITTIGGFIYIYRCKLTQQVMGLKVQNSFQGQNNFKIFLENNNLEILHCKIYLSHNHEIILKPKLFQNRIFSIGFLQNNKYKTKTGGYFYISNYYKQNLLKSNEIKKLNYKLKFGSTIFYIPEAKIQTNTNKKDFKFKDGSYIERHQEIFPNYFATIAGFLKLEGEKQIKYVTIKPGEKYLLEDNIDFFRTLNEQVYFPGEFAGNQFSIKALSYLEIVTNDNDIYLYIRPIIRYEFTTLSYNKILKSNTFNITNLKINNFNLRVSSGQQIQIDEPIQILDSTLTIDSFLQSNDTEVLFEFKEVKRKNSYIKVNLLYSQNFIFDNIIPNEIKKTDVFLNLIVEDNQFIDPYSILASFDTLIQFNNFVYTIKTKRNNIKSNMLLTTKSDYQEIFLDAHSHQYKQAQLIYRNSLFPNNVYIKNSGLLKSVIGNKITLHLGEPYFFSKGALIRKLPGDYIKKQENFGQLIYERLKTGDIVQGLPKIADILEARRPKVEALLSTRQSFIKAIKYTDELIIIITKPNRGYEYFTTPRSERLLIKKYESICIGQPLTEGPLNPHTLLHIYFHYFYSLGTLSIYESAYRSLKKLQIFLLMSVQDIYMSQGVIISGKHVELIVREMTQKVYIEYPGNTTFLPGDIIDLDQAQYINQSLKTRYKLAFRPILLGITKSSLKTDGFLAAASFQETTRVLTHAALQGKTDWLRGLKENAITGRLIPAGTGFYLDQDITYNKILLPNRSINKQNNLNLKKQLRSKQKQFKDLIKFKYNY